VDDATFLRHVYDALKPGGLFLIYNLSPAQNSVESGKPYLPHADGECPFPRELLEKTGFEVIDFDHVDRDKAVEYWMALGISEGKSAEETRKDLFAWYTLCRKAAK
jgi:phytoene/squalene synthetase